MEHLRNLKSLGRLPSEIRDQIQDLNHTDFSKSDAWMGRTISSLIKLGWSETDVRARGEQMKQIIEEVLNN